MTLDLLWCWWLVLSLESPASAAVAAPMQPAFKMGTWCGAPLHVVVSLVARCAQPAMLCVSLGVWYAQLAMLLTVLE
eukprot:525438-Pelagomonas_calceolata.AAC.2